MMPQDEACERKRQLLQDLLQIVSRVSRISGNPGEITSRGVVNEQSELEAMLRRAVNEQHQALRALEDHQQEHGC
jgi:hypothetical protein